jgi:hypothetical protein
MHARVRAALLACAALVALAPSSGAAALAAHGGPVVSRTAAAQALTWSVVPSPNKEINGHIHANELHGISCPSAGSCVAVGDAAAGGLKTLAETWNGTAWSIVPSPNRLAVGDLNGVSCLSATDCTAVGAALPAKDSTQSRTLIETWNGTAWSLVPSPNPSRGKGYDSLSGVSCVSASFCAAVGYHGKSPTTKALIETWNGSTWSVASSPEHGSKSSLSGVSCLSASSCTAVGGYSASGLISGTLVESWNGSTWSVVPSPNAGTAGNNAFSGVSCLSASFCTAVGSYFATDGAFQTLAETWNGSTWSVVTTPDTGSNPTDQELQGVSCTSASACISVGSYEIQAWNGSSWSLMTAPQLHGAPGVGQLNGVSCASATTCMNAGWRAGTEQARHPKTLTELGTASS